MTSQTDRMRAALEKAKITYKNAGVFASAVISAWEAALSIPAEPGQSEMPTTETIARIIAAYDCGLDEDSADDKELVVIEVNYKAAKAIRSLFPKSEAVS